MGETTKVEPSGTGLFKVGEKEHYIFSGKWVRGYSPGKCVNSYGW